VHPFLTFMASIFIQSSFFLWFLPPLLKNLAPQHPSVSAKLFFLNTTSRNSLLPLFGHIISLLERILPFQRLMFSQFVVFCGCGLVQTTSPNNLGPPESDGDSAFFLLHFPLSRKSSESTCIVCRWSLSQVIFLSTHLNAVRPLPPTPIFLRCHCFFSLLLDHVTSMFHQGCSSCTIPPFLPA